MIAKKVFADELLSYIKQFGLNFVEEGCYRILKGFYYTTTKSIDDAEFENQEFVILIENNEIVGISKIINSFDKSMKVIEYVEINEKYRGNGCLRKLIRSVDSLIDSTYDICTTIESECGKEHHVLNIIKEELAKHNFKEEQLIEI